jgi:hypothetical protein
LTQPLETGYWSILVGGTALNSLFPNVSGFQCLRPDLTAAIAITSVSRPRPFV